ncbi:MAG: YceD family protein [Aestuariivirga sp.]|uniref:YceD family protein n=1 Tax=Aestuariivirga sp. TaxID=2650926 RepID=UPI0038D13FCB
MRQQRSSPEFSRPLPTDRVPAGGSLENIAAEPAELTALAARMKLPAIHALSAEIRATPWRGGGIKLEGHITADLEQVSVISLEPFRETVSLPLARYFLPPGGAAEASEDDDADPIEGGVIDLGEVVAETLALDLEPYPRKPGEAFAAHVETAEPPPGAESPFAVLARRKSE